MVTVHVGIYAPLPTFKPHGESIMNESHIIEIDYDTKEESSPIKITQFADYCKRQGYEYEVIKTIFNRGLHYKRKQFRLVLVKEKPPEDVKPIAPKLPAKKTPSVAKAKRTKATKPAASKKTKKVNNE